MKKAFSLVEVLVAAAISVAIILPLSAIFQQSVHQTSSSYDEVRASFLARELIEQMQLMPYIIGYEGIRSISSHSEAEPWLDLSNTELQALFPRLDNKIKEAESRALSCLFLTTLPEKFRRMIKLYPANQSSTPDSYLAHPDLYQLDVMIEWMAPYSTEFNRQLKLSTMIGRDQVIEGYE